MSNPAADLARKRWEGTTDEERAEHGRMMVEERWAKERARRAAAKPAKKPAKKRAKGKR